MPVKHNQNIRVKTKTYGSAECIFDHADLTDADTEQTITWTTLGGEAIPAKARFKDFTIEILVPFDAGGAETLTAKAGEDGGDDDELVTTIDLTAAAGSLTVRDGVKSLDEYEASAYEPSFVFTSDVNLSTFNAGRARAIYYYEQYHTES
jgi:hypothetical protein